MSVEAVHEALGGEPPADERVVRAVIALAAAVETDPLPGSQLADALALADWLERRHPGLAAQATRDR